MNSDKRLEGLQGSNNIDIEEIEDEIISINQ